jgi:hypothetical protein
MVESELGAKRYQIKLEDHSIPIRPIQFGHYPKRCKAIEALARIAWLYSDHENLSVREMSDRQGELERFVVMGMLSGLELCRFSIVEVAQ